MPSKKRKVTKVNVWQKHAAAIEKSGAKTVKDLVSMLKPGVEKKPLVKGVASSDAVDMLIDIGLSVLPSGSLLREEIGKHFKEAPEKITFKNILSSLDEIFKNKDLGETIRILAKESVEYAKSKKLKDPFKVDTSLSDHPSTAHIFRKTILDDAAAALHLKEDQVYKLKLNYSSPDSFMKSKRADIQAATGIPLATIDRFKKVVCFGRTLDISATLASAFASELNHISDFIGLGTSDLRGVIQKSQVPVPQKQRTDKYLGKVINYAKKRVPEVAYYHNVFSSLPDITKKVLNQNKVKTFTDLRSDGLLSKLINDGKVKGEKVISTLKSHTRLEIISKNIDLNNALIRDNIQSAYQISQLTLIDLQKRYKTKASTDELELLHRFSSNLVAKNLPVTAWAHMSSKKHHLNKVINKPEDQDNLTVAVSALTAPNSSTLTEKEPCECLHCASVLSPASYLLALLEFVRVYFYKDQQYLFDRMCGPGLNESKVDCDLVNNQVSQIEIAIGALVEYIRKNSQPELADEDDVYEALAKSINPPPFFYHGTAFKEYLTAIGTSLEEIHSVFIDPEKDHYDPERLAEIIGLTFPEFKRLITQLNDTTVPTTAKVLGIEQSDLDDAINSKDVEKLANFLRISEEDFRLLLWVPLVGTSGDVQLIQKQRFDMLRRVTGLAHALGISISDVAAIISHINVTDLDLKAVESVYKIFSIGNDLRLTGSVLSTFAIKQTNEELSKLLGINNIDALNDSDNNDKPSFGSLAKAFEVSKQDIEAILMFIGVVPEDVDSESLNKLYRFTRFANSSGIGTVVLIDLVATLPSLDDLNDFDKIQKVWTPIKKVQSQGIRLERLTVFKKNITDQQLAELLGKSEQELNDQLTEILDAPDEDKKIEKLSIALNISEDEVKLLLDLGIKDAGTSLDTASKINKLDHLKLLYRPICLSQILEVSFEELNCILEELKRIIGASQMPDDPNNLTYDQVIQAKEILTHIRIFGLDIVALHNVINNPRKEVLAKLLGFIDDQGDGDGDALVDFLTNPPPSTSVEDHVGNHLSTVTGMDASKIKQIATDFSLNMAGWQDVRKIYRITVLCHQLGLTHTELYNLAQEIHLNFASDSIDDALNHFKSYLRICIFAYAFTITPKKLLILLDETGIGNVNHIKTYKQLYWIYRIYALAGSLGISLHQLPGFNLWVHEVSKTHVEDLLSLLESRYEGEQLEKEIKKPNERIWQKTREALITYALSISDPSEMPNVKVLSGELLIDLEVSPCMMTTEIQQAIESVQTFVMRARTGQEDNVDISMLTEKELQNMKEEWRWNRRYVLFEAAMKVFLYPENYLMPQLRDNKTPFFTEIEDELSQGEVTNALAEKTISNYIEKLHAISALRVSGTVYDPATSTLHIFARSQIGDKETYYRTLKDQKVWGPWIKLEAEIDSDRVYPFTAYDRIYIFWVETEEGNDDEYKHTVCFAYQTDINKWCKAKKHKLVSTSGEYYLSWNKDLVLSIDDELDKVIVKVGVLLNDGLIIEHIRVVLSCNDTIVFDESQPSSGIYPTLSTLHQLHFYPESLVEEIWGETLHRVYLSLGRANSTAGINVVLSSGVQHLMGRGAYVPRTGISSLFYKEGKLIFFNGYIQEPISDTHLEIVLGNVLDDSFRVDDAVEIENNLYFFCSDQHRCLMIVAHLSQDDCGTRQVHISICQLNYGKHCSLAGKIFQEGLDALYDPEFQKEPLEADFTAYAPNTDVVVHVPLTELEFHGPNKIYNWELFFHIPMLVASGLSQNRKFEVAAKWYQYICNPYSGGEQVEWRFLPFQQDAVQQLSDYIHDPEDAAIWRADPFSPHALARVRPGAYQKSVILSYIENLLEWADQEFTRDTRESINRARGLYLLAEELLRLKDIEQEKACDRLMIGARVAIVAAVGKSLASDLIDKLENLGNLPSEKIEELHREILSIADSGNNREVNAEMISVLLDRMNGVLARLPRRTIPKLNLDKRLRFQTYMINTEDYTASLGSSQTCVPEEWIGQGSSLLTEMEQAAIRFLSSSMVGCIPENQIFQTHRNHIESNLRKIRSCRNIAGVQRILTIYEASIDVMSVVKSIASGAGYEFLNFSNAAGIGPYRFAYLIERGKSLANYVVQAGNALLLAIEKKESEELAYLRAQQELDLAKANVNLREFGVTEAEHGQDLAQNQWNRADYQFSYFNGLVGDTQPNYNYHEQRALDHLKSAVEFQRVLAGIQTAVAAGSFLTSILGGSGAALQIAYQATTGALSAFAGIESTWSSIHQMQASFQRRNEEWIYQRELALKDQAIAKAQQDIAEDRYNIALQELAIAEMNEVYADQMLEFMKEKFTNKELYAWMEKTLSKLLYGFYNLAYTNARMAQATLEFERNETLDFISYGYWDSEKKGLLSGDKLLLDINKLDDHYVNNNARKLEITKYISLARMAPEALIALKSNGITTFATLTSWFDRDFPGHYQRIIKSVKVTVLALIGPTMGINATLSTVSPSRVILDPGNPVPVEVPRVQSVALSAPANATGLFELNYRDERYLPFEGCGVDVMWELEMPKPSNRFDFNTIVDVILTIDYTALSDSDYKQRIIQELGTDTGGMLPISVRTNFPDAWYHFNNPVWLSPPSEGGDAYEQTGTTKPYTIKLEANRAIFPPNEENHKVERVAFSFNLEDSNIRLPINVKFESENGDVFERKNLRTGEGGYLALESGITGLSPFGTWEIEVDRDNAPEALWASNDDGTPRMEDQTELGKTHHILDTDKISDMILAITYSAEVQWPSEA